MHTLQRFSTSLIGIVFLATMLFSGIANAATTGYIPNADIKTDPLANRSGLEKGGAVLDQAQFGVDHFSGSASYNYPLAIPKGRKQLTPTLSLNYSSGARNLSNLAGYGWELSEASITRSDRKGVNHLYDNTNEFQLNLFGEGGELVALQLSDGKHGTYGKRMEDSFHRIEYRSDESWTINTQEGLMYWFGKSEQSRQFDAADGSRIYRWMLEQVTDFNGNYIRFEYTKDQNEIYPSAIHYTGHGTPSTSNDGPFKITFSYEDRLDDGINYRPGFRVVTGKRLKQIQATVQGEPSQHSWTFEYQNGDNDYRSLLSKITENATYREGETVTLPPSIFSYSASSASWKDTTTDSLEVELINNNGEDLGNEVVDVNGDGYVDIVATWIQDDATAAANGVPSTCDMTGKACYKKEDPTTYLNNTQNAWLEDADWDSGIKFLKNQMTLIDLNGDLLPDIYNPAKYKGFLVNLGQGWADPYKYDDSEVNDSGIRFIDINGDGLSDWVYKLGYDYKGEDSAGEGTAFNDGKLHFESINSGWTLPATTAFSPSRTISSNAYPLDSGLRFIDANGDGLMDVALALQYDVNQDGKFTQYDQIIQELYLNNGKDGWVLETGSTFPFYFTDVYYTNGWNSSTKEECLYDITEDGLIDWRSDNTVSGVNNGVNGWTQISLPTTLPECGGSGNSNGTTAYRTADVNGDSLMDEIITSENADDYLSLSQSVEYPDLLTGITTASGGKISVTYKMSSTYRDENGKLLNPKLPFPMATVSKVEYDDGLGGKNMEEYTYFNGRYNHYEAFRSEFAGFEKVEEKRNDRLTVYHFSQGCSGADPCTNPLYATGTLFKSGTNDTVWVMDGNYRRGFTSRSAFENSGFSWYDVQVVDQAIIDALPEGEVWDSEFDDFQYPVNLSNYAKKGRLVRKEVLNLSGNKYVQEDSIWLVHDFGNQRYFPYLEKKIEFVFDGKSAHRDRAWRYRYDTQTGRPVQIEELGEVKADPAQSTISDELDGDDRSTTYSYTIDNSRWLVTPDLEKQVDAKGNQIAVKDYHYDSQGVLEQVLQWVNTTDEWVRTYFTIDEYGMVKKETNPGDYDTAITYDSHHLYPQEIRNPLNQTVTTQIDLLTGKALTQKDANGFERRWSYDGFGRLKQESRPDPQTGTPTVVTQATYDNDQVPGLAQTITTVNGIVMESRVYWDGFGRQIQTWSSTEDGFSVQDNWYDPSGNLQKKSLPYRSTQTDFMGRKSDAFFATYTYDALGRVRTEQLPTGTTSSTYDHWITTSTDPNGNVKTVYYDGFNRLIEVDEFNDGETYKTHYEYNALDQLSKLTDAKGNVRHFTYDSLSRKLTQEDLHASSEDDFGKWSYTYDRNGNLMTQKNPEGEITRWTYDELDRVKTQDEHDDGTIEITTIYDTASNGIGLVAEVQAENVQINYAYDAGGNVIQETQSIGGASHTSQMAYDILGRMIDASYPEGFMNTRYAYNKAGLLENVTKDQTLGLLGDLDYSPAGQISAVTYANGILTTNTYDPAKNQRLTQRVTASPYNTYDEDGDGYTSAVTGGTDCDDTNPLINPEALDSRSFDHVDSDCDGLDYAEGGTVKVKDSTGEEFEVFKYEASKGDSGKAESVKGVMPWTSITPAEAQTACKGIGGMLTSVDVWQKSCGGEASQLFPYGTTYDPGACNDSSGSGSIEPTGNYPECISPYGANDLLGNVGEAVYDENGEGLWLGGSTNTDSRGATCQDIWYSEADFGGDMPERSAIGFRCMRSELIDTDDDRVPDNEETSRYNTDPLNPDTDFDRLLDGEEIYDHLTDPLKADMDEDLLLDGDEVKTYDTDPKTFDTDGDGLPDSITYFETHLDEHDPNPTTESTIAWNGKVAITLIDPALTGVYLEGVEYQIETDEQADWLGATPSDGTWDSFDENYTFTLENLTPGEYTVVARGKASLGQNPVWSAPSSITFKVLADADQDGVEDASDNCPQIGNPDQQDLDGDGLGDACDEDRDGDGTTSNDDCNDENPSIGAASTYYEDTDGDGHGSGEPLELCPHEMDASMNYATSGGDAFPEDGNEWSDTDGDGVGDNSDVFPEDPTEWSDSDGDEVGDNGDNCPDTFNTDQSDSDANGIGDACDEEEPDEGNDTEDVDGDGIASWADCDDENPDVGAPTTYYEDTDGDGYGSGEPIKACPDELSTDHNYVLQNGDAFPENPNEWKDTDGDGVGDNSDLCVGTKPIDGKDTVSAQGCALSQLDTDMDGLTDYEEVVMYKTDPLKKDTDKDGLTDRQEIENTHTDPLKKDTDGDGLSDGSEVYIVGTDPLDPDTDNDGKSDGAEVKNPKYDPLNPLKKAKKVSDVQCHSPAARGSLACKIFKPIQAFLDGWIPKASAQSDSMVIQDFTYTYDPAGNIVEIQDNSETITKKTMNYDYDDLNRLVSAKSSEYALGDYEQIYDHDPIGNMTYKSDVGQMQYAGTGSPSPHAVTSVAGMNYTYDKNGNLLSDGIHTYEWNIQNQLVASDGHQFEYDPFGNLLKSIDPEGKETIYVGRWMEIRPDRVLYYIWAGSMRVAAVDVPRHEDGSFGDSSEGKLIYFHQDHLGSTTLATDEKGKIVQLYDYAPFGNQITNENEDSSLVAHSFTDKEFKEDLGLYYFGARWYSPETGQFVSPDPLDGMSYVYANNNPLIFIDPTGLESALVFYGDEYKSEERGVSVDEWKYKAESRAAELGALKDEDGNLVYDDGVYAVDGTTFMNWQDALWDYEDISLIEYYGHGASEGIYISAATEDGNSRVETIFSNAYKGELDYYDDGRQDHYVENLYTGNVSEDLVIKLWSCNAARGGSKSVAQSFANQFSAPVWASTTFVNFNGNNPYTNWRWKTFGGFKWTQPQEFYWEQN